MDTQAVRLNRDDSGATAVEYALMAALIALVIVVAVTALGVNLNALFNDLASQSAFQ
jgi:pilus assembly protein Flp/PilA